MSSLIYEAKLKKTISLLPDELSDVKASIQAHLNEMLLQWEDTVKGIILSYRKVKVLKSGLGIIDDFK